MATVLYINADPSRQAFGNSLGCGYRPDVPQQFASIATAPCVILAGGGLPPVVIPDDGTLTPAKVTSALAPILAAEQAAAAAAATGIGNTAALQAALDLRLGQIEAFIAANPNGAVLTAAQTLVVAKMLAGLTRVIRNAVGTTGQAG